MIPIEPQPHTPTAQIIDVAKRQPEYAPLRVSVDPLDPHVTFVTEWEFSAEELATLLNGGRLRLSVLTFGLPLQPVLLEVIA